MTRRHAIDPSPSRSCRESARSGKVDPSCGLHTGGRAAAAVASVIVSCLIPALIVLGMTDDADAPAVATAGPSAAFSAA